MPLIRVDIPEGQSRETEQALYDVIHDGILTTWASDHIYIALSEKFPAPGDRQVLMTVDLRRGRGNEAECLRAPFDVLQPAFEKALGTGPEDLIVLVRHFPQEACLPGGKTPHPLGGLTPDPEAAE